MALGGADLRALSEAFEAGKESGTVRLSEELMSKLTNTGQMMNVRNVAANTFTIRFPTRTPCVDRSAIWFHDRADALLAAAVEKFKTEKKWTGFGGLTEEARAIVCDKVVKAYMAASAQKRSEVVVKQGCCTFPHCAVSGLAWCLVWAIRDAIRKEDADAVSI